MKTIDAIQLNMLFKRLSYNKHLVFITGHATHGKTFLANFLKELYMGELEIYSFANPLKEIVKKYFGVTKETEYLKYDEGELKTNIEHLLVDYEEFKSIPEEGWELLKQCNNGRKWLQIFGTNIVRRYVSDTYWIDYAIRNIKHSPEYADKRIVVIDDLRFINEIFNIPDRKKTIIRKVSDKPVILESNHISEQEHLKINPDYVIGRIQIGADFPTLGL